MTPERQAAAVHMLGVLRRDLEADMAELDGKPFTGPNVAAELGTLAAQIDALARVVLAMLEDPS